MAYRLALDHRAVYRHNLGLVVICVPLRNLRKAHEYNRRAKFKERCLALLDQLDAQGLVVTKHGKPVARVLPYEAALCAPHWQLARQDRDSRGHFVYGCALERGC